MAADRNRALDVVSLAHDDSRSPAANTRTLGGVTIAHEIEFVFEPQEDGGYHAYAPGLPGLHTEGDSLEEATENAREALALYAEGLGEDGRSPDPV